MKSNNSIVQLMVILIIMALFVSLCGGFLYATILIITIAMLMIIVMRNIDIKKHKTIAYDEDELIIQNVGSGGVIQLINLKNREKPLDLKVINKHLYMEGDYSWYELECKDSYGNKHWLEVDDDDELVVTVVLEKPEASDLRFSASLDHIDYNETGSVSYKGVKYKYHDSAAAEFYRYCDSNKKEKLYYWDFRYNDEILTVEQWGSGENKSKEYFLSQRIYPRNIVIYSTKGA